MAPSTQYSSWHIVGAQSILILKFNRRKIKDFSEYCIEEPSIKICNYQRQICAAFLTETGHINFQALQEPPSCKACSIDIKLRCRIYLPLSANRPFKDLPLASQVQVLLSSDDNLIRASLDWASASIVFPARTGTGELEKGHVTAL